MIEPVTELYVYYRIAPAQMAGALAVFEAWPDVQLLKRADEAAAPEQTWMEIHRGPDAEASERSLALLLAAFVTGPRHVERFEPVRLTRP